MNERELERIFERRMENGRRCGRCGKKEGLNCYSNRIEGISFFQANNK